LLMCVNFVLIVQAKINMATNRCRPSKTWFKCCSSAHILENEVRAKEFLYVGLLFLLLAYCAVSD